MPIIEKDLDNNNNLIYCWDESMHSRIDYIIYGDNKDNLNEAVTEISHTLTYLENIGNRFNLKSEVFRLNQGFCNTPIKLSDTLFDILKQGKDNFQKSLGYFDITIQSHANINNRWEHIFFDEDNKSIVSDIENISFDLGGWLKGFAVDKIIDIIDDKNISNGFIDFGHSSIRAIGRNYDNSDWVIACKTATAIKNVAINNFALSTSGNETIDREHIINPFSGEYLKGINVISVKSPTAAKGEVLSTALCCSPKEKWNNILDAFEGEIID
ncbi:MAG: FAD:protein FMN transferase [Bacteroidales bacterium]|nr:FAD:protein FMN transferase [Bacteroidales bacterium]